MFKKILIANRGEIACRVIATARRMGIATVAVFSEADAQARHVLMADEAIAIGAAPVSASYLLADRIIEAALRTGAHAIHPGYGFLSENAEFVEAAERAGLVFIGPPAGAIRAMGLKDAAKALMAKAGVPVVPGYHGGRQELAFLAEQAAAIGYPVLIKARAGGGGKGMRLVERPEDFAAALESARREAQSSFADADCLIEKYIERPRHIEMQIFADAQGNVVHLFERDCSLQRRHQKVIEEAPAPGMTAAMRAAMGRAATEAARTIGYRGAGTVEFIVDASDGLREDGFWFMEMNTRLQVEHPVTEAITGLDMVELQLQVAAGLPLPFNQDDLVVDGWSMEARVYAEDARRNFLPATGRLARLAFPEATQFGRGEVRIDSGVYEGDTITPFYDPMIAKVIVHGTDRASALARLATAIAGCRIAGSKTNLEFLAGLVADQDVQAGTMDTGLIARKLDALVAPVQSSVLEHQLAAILGTGLVGLPAAQDPWSAFAGFSQWQPVRRFQQIEHDGARTIHPLRILGPGLFEVGEDGATRRIAVSGSREAGFWFVADGHRQGFDFVLTESAIVLLLDGRSIVFDLPDAFASATDAGPADGSLFAVMPGVVIAIMAEPGAVVESGTPLVTMEAMKMEQTLTAPRRCRVAEITVAVGDQVPEGTLLVRLETADAE